MVLCSSPRSDSLLLSCCTHLLKMPYTAYLSNPLQKQRASLVAQLVKNWPTIQKTLPWFNPCIRKFPWRREWLPDSYILAWRIPWTKDPGGLESMGCKESDWVTDTFIHTNKELRLVNTTHISPSAKEKKKIVHQATITKYTKLFWVTD